MVTITGCTSYGNKIDMNGDEIYYTDPVSEEQANKVGEFLTSYQYFTGQGYAIQVVKDTNFKVRFVTKEGIENDEEVVGGFKFLQIDMSNAAFDGQPVDIDLCNEKLETKMTITYADAKSFLDKMMQEQGGNQ